MQTTIGNMSKNRTRTKDKYRVVYNDTQRIELENEFRQREYIGIPRKVEIANKLQLSERQIKIWFQNRRAKKRKQEKRTQSGTISGDNQQHQQQQQQSHRGHSNQPSPNIDQLTTTIAHHSRQDKLEGSDQIMEAKGVSVMSLPSLNNNNNNINTIGNGSIASTSNKPHNSHLLHHHMQHHNQHHNQLDYEQHLANSNAIIVSRRFNGTTGSRNSSSASSSNSNQSGSGSPSFGIAGIASGSPQPMASHLAGYNPHPVHLSTSSLEYATAVAGYQLHQQHQQHYQHQQQQQQLHPTQARQQHPHQSHHLQQHPQQQQLSHTQNHNHHHHQQQQQQHLQLHNQQAYEAPTNQTNINLLHNGVKVESSEAEPSLYLASNSVNLISYNTIQQRRLSGTALETADILADDHPTGREEFATFNGQADRSTTTSSLSSVTTATTASSPTSNSNSTSSLAAGMVEQTKLMSSTASNGLTAQPVSPEIRSAVLPTTPTGTDHQQSHFSMHIPAKVVGQADHLDAQTLLQQQQNTPHHSSLSTSYQTTKQQQQYQLSPHQIAVQASQSHHHLMPVHHQHSPQLTGNQGNQLGPTSANAHLQHQHHHQSQMQHHNLHQHHQLSHHHPNHIQAQYNGFSSGNTIQQHNHHPYQHPHQRHHHHHQMMIEQHYVNAVGVADQQARLTTSPNEHFTSSLGEQSLYYSSNNVPYIHKNSANNMIGKRAVYN